MKRRLTAFLEPPCSRHQTRKVSTTCFCVHTYEHARMTLRGHPWLKVVHDPRYRLERSESPALTFRCYQLACSSSYRLLVGSRAWLPSMMRSSARPFLSKLMQIVCALTTIAVAAIGRGVTEGETRKSLSVAAPRLGRDGKWRSAWSTCCRSAGKSSRGRKALRVVMAMLVMCSTHAAQRIGGV